MLRQRGRPDSGEKQTHHPRHYHQESDGDNLARYEAARNNLIGHTNWDQLVHDYAYRDKDDPTLDSLPDLVSELSYQDSDTPAAQTEYLNLWQERLDEQGYLSRQPIQPEAERPLPTEDLFDLLSTWYDDTYEAMHYWSGDRLEAAGDNFPQHAIPNIYHLASRPGNDQLPSEILSALWRQANATMRRFDDSVEPKLHSRYHTVDITGSDHLRPYRIPPEMFEEWVNTAISSYPPYLLKGLEHLEISRGPVTSVVNGETLYTNGEMIPAHRTLRIYTESLWATLEAPRNNWDKARQAFHQSLERVIDHELAHLAHSNAPISWLRKWVRLTNQNPVNVSEYVEILDDAKLDRIRHERLADSIAIYRINPVDLIKKSEAYFEMINQLLGWYDTDTVAESTKLIKTGDDGELEAKTILNQSRVAKLRERLHQFNTANPPHRSVAKTAIRAA